MNKWASYYTSDKGVSLVEILASIVILSIIIISLITMFIQSSRTNSVSKNMMDATYVAEANMEEIYNIVVSSTSYDIATAAVTSKGYTQLSKTSTNAFFEKNEAGHYVYIELVPTPNSSLVKVRVKVYKDRSKADKKAQMEILLSWKKQ
ncbi:hypothetical protein [Neobacillus sp. LXY-4]|uniref:hypothetical protein n=1 Tax=Neobacillus sp. LXY-4 TaxID=3379826 RepID=UPI003EDF48DB